MFYNVLSIYHNTFLTNFQTTIYDRVKNHKIFTSLRLLYLSKFEVRKFGIKIDTRVKINMSRNLYR